MVMIIEEIIEEVINEEIDISLLEIECLIICEMVS